MHVLFSSSGPVPEAWEVEGLRVYISQSQYSDFSVFAWLWFTSWGFIYSRIHSGILKHYSMCFSYLILSGESSRSFFLNLLSVSSMVLPILSLISPSFSLKGKAPLLLSQSSSHLHRSNSLADKTNTEIVCNYRLNINTPFDYDGKR